MGPVYYAQLDTTRYAELAVQAQLIESRTIAATAALSLDLMVTRRAVVLSQNQVFDGGFLLSQVQPHVNSGKDERKAAKSLRKLIRENWIQTRIYPEGLIERGSAEEKFTVANAFVSKLDTGFRFSAWPELGESPDLRRAVRDAVERRRTEGLDPIMAHRVEGLLVLDDAFRSSSSSEQARIVEGPKLGERISDHMKREQVPRFLRNFYHLVMTFHQSVVDGDVAEVSRDTRAAMMKPDHLDYRSNWYALLEQYSQKEKLVEPHAHLDWFRAVVDFHYNSIVAESLGAGNSTDETEDLTLPQALRGSKFEPEYHGIATMLVDPTTPGDPVTWSTVRSQLNDLPGSWDDAGRLHELLEQRVVQLTQNDRLVTYVHSLPVRTTSTAKALLRMAVGGAIGSPYGELGMAAGAVVGACVEEFLPEPPRFVEEFAPIRALHHWTEQWVKSVENYRREAIRASLISRAKSYTPDTAKKLYR